MKALLRNPLLKLLMKLWWVPALSLLVVNGLGGGTFSWLADVGAISFVAALVGLVSAAWAHGTWAAVRQRALARQSGNRFLCPHCLTFGEFQFACGACGDKVEPFVVHTNGIYVNDCPGCEEPLFTRDGQEGRGVRAYCEQCHGHCDRDVYHKRQVRVVATLLQISDRSLSHTAARQAAPLENGMGHVIDDGSRLTYVLNLGRFIDRAGALPPAHAFREVESIWLDASEGDPEELALELGRAADQFIRETGLTEKQRQALTAYVHQNALPPAAENVLETRFGAVRYGTALHRMG